MKMITAIVNKKDTSSVCRALTDAGFSFTQLATTGGFLRAGNTTLLIGVDDDKVTEAIDVMRDKCKERTELVPTITGYNAPSIAAYPAEVIVGGATIFVTDVSHFEKL